MQSLPRSQHFILVGGGGHLMSSKIWCLNVKHENESRVAKCKAFDCHWVA